MSYFNPLYDDDPYVNYDELISRELQLSNFKDWVSSRINDQSDQYVLQPADDQSKELGDVVELCTAVQSPTTSLSSFYSSSTSESLHVTNETVALPDEVPYMPAPSVHKVDFPLLPPQEEIEPISSQENEDEESDDDGSDDDYTPSSPERPRKRSVGLIQLRGAPKHATPSTISTPNKRPRLTRRFRNVQAPSTSSTPTPPKTNPWACPHCPWVQRNRRSPDLKRHIRTHTRISNPSQWICCGIPVEDAASHGIRDCSGMRLYGDKQFVGGCGREFSRRDALKRHLDNSNIGCVGDLSVGDD